LLGQNMTSNRMSGLIAIVCVVSLTSILRSDDAWQLLDSGVAASLRGLCVVDADVVWASGSDGTVVRTSDGGGNWIKASVVGAGKLDFRDVHAFDTKQAVIVSAGQPARVYRTTNGGESWKMCHEHPDPGSFFDALSFWDERHGIAMSDPIDGRVLLIETRDGGNSWTELPPERRPQTLPGEAGFAASGTNMQIKGDRVFVALGGADEKRQEPASRIFYSADRAKTWQVATAPIARDASSGIFSLAFMDQQHGIAVGGNYLKPESKLANFVLTSDGGVTWHLSPGDPPRGYRSGVAFGKEGDRSFVVCVGPTGTDISNDGGQSWQAASATGFHAVAFSPDGKSGFACGSDGRVAKWIWNRDDR
jgi:photosystem II stability/assembly factor-like uncharacterized protein